MKEEQAALKKEFQTLLTQLMVLSKETSDIKAANESMQKSVDDEIETLKDETMTLEHSIAEAKIERNDLLQNIKASKSFKKKFGD